MKTAIYPGSFDPVTLGHFDIIKRSSEIFDQVIVRGLRAITDFEYELQLAQMNRVIAPEIDTLFLTTNLKYAYLSSSMAKEVAMYGGDISEFLDPVIAKQVQEKYQALQEDRECK